MSERPQLKLGKLEPACDRRTLRFESYWNVAVSGALPEVADFTPPGLPAVPDWHNHTFRCSCEAAIANAVISWDGLLHRPSDLTGEQVLEFYRMVSGFDPATGCPDRGSVLLACLKHWRKRGMGGHKLDAFVWVDPSRREQVKAALLLTRGLLCGMALPLRAMQQFRGREIWEGRHLAWGIDHPGSWGGAAWWLQGYARDSVFGHIWTKPQPASWQWWQAYVDECYAPICTELVNQPGGLGKGFDLPRLMRDVQAL